MLYQLSYVGARGILVQTKRHVAGPQRGAPRSKPASAGDAMHLTVYVIAGHDGRICNQPGHDVAGMYVRFDVKWATHSRGWAHSPASGASDSARGLLRDEEAPPRRIAACHAVQAHLAGEWTPKPSRAHSAWW